MVCDLWLVDFDPFGEFLCFKVICLWSSLWLTTAKNAIVKAALELYEKTWENSHRREFHTGMTFFISYRVCIMAGSFHISLFEGTLHVVKIHLRFKIANMRMRYPFQSTSRLISHRNLWSFRVCMIPLRDFVPEWNSRPGTTTGVNSRRHDILWWYHVNKCRVTRGNRSELTPARKSPPRHVKSPLEFECLWKAQ